MKIEFLETKVSQAQTARALLLAMVEKTIEKCGEDPDLIALREALSMPDSDRIVRFCVKSEDSDLAYSRFRTFDEASAKQRSINQQSKDSEYYDYWQKVQDSSYIVEVTEFERIAVQSRKHYSLLDKIEKS